MTTHTLNNFWLKLVSLFNFETKPEPYSRRAYRETYKALDSLTDRELLDIGITRGDIHDVAYEYSKDLEAKQNTNLKGWT